MPIVTVASGKGGVSKTTTALALAAAMSSYTPVLLDFDAGADATRGSGLTPEGQRIANLFGSGTLESESVQSDEGFSIVPGSAATAVFEATNKVTLPDLRSRLIALAGPRLVIIDTSPGFTSPLTRAAVGSADVLIVPLLLEPFAADRALHVVDVARSQGSEPITLFVAASVDARLNLSDAVLEDLVSQGVQIAATIPRMVAVAESPWRSRSIVNSAPKSKAAEAYRSLAWQVAEALQLPIPKSKSQMLNPDYPVPRG